MKKEEAIKIMTKCAKDYHTYLENKNLLFLFGSKENPYFFEAVFLPRHFLHLTGAQISKNRISGSSEFYKKALKNQLSPNDFSLTSNGTTEMKLSVLPQLMKIYRSAKMVGDYNFTKSVLYTEKLVGNITASLGFVRDNRYYIPNTALKEDIRDITTKPQSRILAILKKSKNESYYEEICYKAKGILLQDISIPQTLSNKIHIEGI